jgi:hypothetical protein
MEKFERIIRWDLLVITADLLNKSDRSGHTGCKAGKVFLCEFVGPAIIEDEKPELVLYIQHISDPDCLVFAIIDMVGTPSEKWLDKLKVIEIVSGDKSCKIAIVNKGFRKLAGNFVPQIERI